MKSISSGQRRQPQDEFARALDVDQFDRRDLIDDTEECVERRLYRVPPIDGDVSMQDVLQYLSARDQPFPGRHGRLEQAPGRTSAVRAPGRRTLARAPFRFSRS